MEILFTFPPLKYHILGAICEFCWILRLPRGWSSANRHYHKTHLNQHIWIHIQNRKQRSALTVPGYYILINMVKKNKVKVALWCVFYPDCIYEQQFFPVQIFTGKTLEDIKWSQFVLGTLCTTESCAVEWKETIDLVLKIKCISLLSSMRIA